MTTLIIVVNSFAHRHVTRQSWLTTLNIVIGGEDDKPRLCHFCAPSRHCSSCSATSLNISTVLTTLSIGGQCFGALLFPARCLLLEMLSISKNVMQQLASSHTRQGPYCTTSHSRCHKVHSAESLHYRWMRGAHASCASCAMIRLWRR